MSGSVSTKKQSIGRLIAYVLTGFALFLILAAILYSQAFGPVAKSAEKTEFLVQPDESVAQIAENLTEQGYIRSPWVFQVAFIGESFGKGIRPGGYEISKSMDALSIASALVAPPYSAWVKVPVGMRKEQIAELLQDALGWSDAQKEEWITVATNTGPNYREGVYFPDTYFIPSEMSPSQVASLMRDRFRAEFAPFADEALEKDMPWPEVLTIASIIQREAGSLSDMYIISGVIQKRLKVGMPLAMDATLQYIEGSEGRWWPKPKAAATYPNTEFNTYKNTGLPPHPIANPGLAAIEAALNPADTDCLFYLHDNDGQIHCSANYAGQLANVNKYLR